MKDCLEELVAKVKQGNPTATYDLLYKVFKDSLVKVISKIKRCSDDIQIEIILSDFYFYLLTPTKRDNRFRLEKLDVGSNIESYLNNALRNWLVEQLREEQQNYKRNKPIPVNYSNENSDSTEESLNSTSFRDKTIISTTDDDETNLGKKIDIENKVWAIIMALESIPALKTKDRYILLTYMMGERYKGMGGPLHISRFLSNQLDMTEAAVKMRYKRNLERLREEAEKYL